MQALAVGPRPPVADMPFARSEDFLASIDRNGRRVGAVVFGTVRKPYKVNLLGECRGRFETWAEAVEFVSTFDVDSLA